MAVFESLRRAKLATWYNWRTWLRIVDEISENMLDARWCNDRKLAQGERVHVKGADIVND